MLLERSHYIALKKSYEKVGNEMNDQVDFFSNDLLSSRNFFTNKSLEQRKPVPIDVEVFAILSGISFENNFLDFIYEIYQRINLILSDALYYLVKEENLGVEYAVLKWPGDNQDNKVIETAKNLIKDYPFHEFHLRIFGIQVHKDGCIVLKAVDERKEIFKFRESIISNIKGIPKKQSSWAHIPIGRILEPIGKDKMDQLKKFLLDINSQLNYDLLIEEIHLVHEKKWYMEEKDYLITKKFKEFN